MYLRDTDFETLEEVYTKVIDRRRTWSGSSTKPVIRLADGTEEQDTPNHEPGMSRIGTIHLEDHEVPANARSLQALAQFYDVPFKFLERVPNDEKQFILDHRIQRSEDVPLVVKYTDSGISEAYRGGRVRVRVQDLVEKVMDVFDPDSKVIEWFNTPEEFRLDVIVPEDHDRYIGGDRKVGDLTHGGVRVGQNRKQNLAPWMQTLMFRLACTNGMEVPDYGLRIDARHADEEEILSMFRSEVSRALDRVESDIKHFYDLRSIPVEDDPTGLFRRMTRELGLPDRIIGRMENTLADEFLAEEQMTMFHLVNHVTNQANDPNIRHKYNPRRALEQAGGQMIADHAARCDKCHARLN